MFRIFQCRSWLIDFRLLQLFWYNANLEILQSKQILDDDQYSRFVDLFTIYRIHLSLSLSPSKYILVNKPANILYKQKRINHH